MKRAFLLMVVGVAVATLTASPVAAQSRPSMAADTPDEVAVIVLYNQLDNPGGSYTAQNFEAAYDIYDAFGADDFIVPANTSWKIQGIGVNGSTTVPGNEPASFNVSFHLGDGGLPDDPPKLTLSNQSYQLVNGTYRISLSQSPNIPGGPNGRTVWISVQANMDFLPAGNQWFWTSRTVQANSAGAWKNPGDGFLTGCTGWGALSSCLLVAEPDWGFILVGTSSPSP